MTDNLRDKLDMHQELVADIRRDILIVGSIYPTVGKALFDEAITRMAERIASTVKKQNISHFQLGD